MANGNVAVAGELIGSYGCGTPSGQFVNLSLDQLVNEVRHEAELLRYGPIRTYVDHNDDRPSQRPVRTRVQAVGGQWWRDRLGQ